MFKTTSKRIISAIIMLLMLCGCFGTGETNDITPTPDPDPVVDTTPIEDLNVSPLSGGTLRLSMRQPLTLNPILNEDKTVDAVLRLLFEPLAVLDENQRPVPNIAEDINFSSDGLSAVITLKSGLLWSDGEPITSQDIVFTLSAMQNAPELSIYKRNLKNIQSFEPVDELSVKINYSESFQESYHLLMFPIIPSHYYNQGESPDSERNMHPVGNGTYKFVEYEIMRCVRLEQNDLSPGEKPYISDITVIISPDYQTDLYSFEQGIIDVLVSDFDVWGDYGAGKEPGICEFDSMLLDFIGFNFASEKMNKLEVRRAVAHAVDLTEIAGSVYLSHANITKTIMHPNSWLYEENVAEYPYDLELAKEFIAESEVKFNEEEPVVIIVNIENPERVKIAEMLSEALNEIGVYNTIEAELFFEYSERLNAGEYDIVVGGFYLDNFPDFTIILHSEQDGEYGNIFNYRSDYMDSLLAIVEMSGTETTFKRAMGDIQQEVCEDLPLIGIAYRKGSLLTDKRVYGEKKPVINNTFNNIHEWFIEYEAE